MAGQQDAFETYRTQRRFDALDGLRAFAAAAVVWHHCTHDKTGYFGRGIGVTTFFVVSGFLITRILFRDEAKRGSIAIGEFWLRRALRIFPLYFAILAVYVVLVARFERDTAAGAAFWTSLPYYASFTTNWFVDRSEGQRVIFYFAWSLAVQEQFYLFWPVILRLFRRRYAFFFPLAFLVVADILTWLNRALGLHGALTARILGSLDTPIFLGVVAAFLLESRRTFPFVHRVAGQRWSVPLALVLVLLPKWIPGVPQDLFALVIAYLVVACVLAPPRAAKVVDNRLARHIGNVSYGIYLLHMLALNSVRYLLPAQAPPLLVFSLGFPLVVLAATASHRWFEQPFMRLRERLAASQPLERHPGVPLIPGRGAAG